MLLGWWSSKWRVNYREHAFMIFIFVFVFVFVFGREGGREGVCVGVRACGCVLVNATRTEITFEIKDKNLHDAHVLYVFSSTRTEIRRVPTKRLERFLSQFTNTSLCLQGELSKGWHDINFHETSSHVSSLRHLNAHVPWVFLTSVVMTCLFSEVFVIHTTKTWEGPFGRKTSRVMLALVGVLDGPLGPLLAPFPCR